MVAATGPESYWEAYERHSAIKLRAWNRRTREMRAVEFGAEEYHFGWCVEHDGFASIEDYTFMRCTGLTDKNGTEIYEGDLLATSNDDPEYDLWTRDDLGTTAVYWHDVLCRFLGTKWQWDIGPDSVYGLPFVEVVGNIYEQAH